MKNTERIIIIITSNRYIITYKKFNESEEKTHLFNQSHNHLNITRNDFRENNIEFSEYSEVVNLNGEYARVIVFVNKETNENNL